MALTRIGDWELALHDYMVANDGLPHVYGTRDCVLFAAGAVQALTGVDLAAKWRGKYKTEAGALRTLCKLSDGTVQGLIYQYLPTIPTSFARRGDIALFEGSAGVVMGPYAVFVGAYLDEEGEELPPAYVLKFRHEWEKAWAVG